MTFRIALLLLAIVACSSSRPGPGPGSGVLQHHNNPSRDGVYVDPLMTKAAVAALHLDSSFVSPTLLGPIHGQVLYLDGVGDKPDLVFAATAQNHVYALRASTGALVWDQVLGSPGVRPADVCTPGPVGISSTPIIDGARRTIYVNAMTSAMLDGGLTNKHLVYALDADSGRVQTGWPVDVDTKARVRDVTFDSSVQNQRGALALLDGTLFIPYGGASGDCGDYHGWVVGISTADPTKVSAWATRALKGGIWAPAGIASDGSSLYFATGNTIGADTWQDGEAVFKLAPSLLASNSTNDYFAPTNWAELDAADLDLGGTAPVLVDVPGASPSKLVLAMGKDRMAYLLDRTNLGGVGAPLAAELVAAEGIITAAAAYTTPAGTFVAFRGFGNTCPAFLGEGHLAGLKITATPLPTIVPLWCSLPKSLAAPAISMTDTSGANAVIWMIGTDERLYARDGETGAAILDGSAVTDTINGVEKFQTPIIAHGRVFAAGSDRVYAFGP